MEYYCTVKLLPKVDTYLVNSVIYHIFEIIGQNFFRALDEFGDKEAINRWTFV